MPQQAKDRAGSGLRFANSRSSSETTNQTNEKKCEWERILEIGKPSRELDSKARNREK